MSICFGKYYSMLGVFRLFGVFVFLVFKGGVVMFGVWVGVLMWVVFFLVGFLFECFGWDFCASGFLVGER